jgi:hypothetical protein
MLDDRRCYILGEIELLSPTNRREQRRFINFYKQGPSPSNDKTNRTGHFDNRRFLTGQVRNWQLALVRRIQKQSKSLTFYVYLILYDKINVVCVVHFLNYIIIGCSS